MLISSRDSLTDTPRNNVNPAVWAALNDTWKLTITHTHHWLRWWQIVKNLPAIQATQVWSLGWEDPLEKGMATHSSVLACGIPWTEELSGLQSMGSKRIGYDRDWRLLIPIIKLQRSWLPLPKFLLPPLHLSLLLHTPPPHNISWHSLSTYYVQGFRLCALYASHLILKLALWSVGSIIIQAQESNLPKPLNII